MRPVLTAAGAQAIEREAEARGTPVAALMERAGAAVARTAVELAGGAYGRRAVVVCGKGNNGGDGMVAARRLAAAGMGVAVFPLAEASDLREPTASNFARLAVSGVRRVAFEAASLDRELERADVAIDAIFGTGFRGAPRDAASVAIEAFDRHDVPRVSADIPSGVESDTGAIRGARVRATVTVTFGAPKIGNVLPPGALVGGSLEIADIGFPPELVSTVPSAEPFPWEVSLLERGDAPVPAARLPGAHKRDAVVLAIAGSRGMTGAPRLVAQGAYRAGAGLVALAVPRGILPIVQSDSIEPVFVSLDEGEEGAVSEAAWDRLARDAGAADALAVGPGLSTDGGAPDLVRRLVREATRPLVLDADALNAFAGRTGELADRSAPAVLTPHEGELARLMGTDAEAVREDRLGVARKVAAETGAIVLLKGWRTLVVRPDGRAVITATGTPALATGGTGDVLTGAIAAFIARGLGPAEAAVGAAYVHGLAGRLTEDVRGEGTLASDVAAALPEAVARVREGRA